MNSDNEAYHTESDDSEEDEYHNTHSEGSDGCSTNSEMSDSDSDILHDGESSAQDYGAMVEEVEDGTVKVWITGKLGTVALFCGTTFSLTDASVEELGFTIAVVRKIDDNGLLVDGYCEEQQSVAMFDLSPPPGEFRNAAVLLCPGVSVPFSVVDRLHPPFDVTACRSYSNGSWHEQQRDITRKLSLAEIYSNTIGEVGKGTPLVETNLYAELLLLGLGHCIPSAAWSHVVRAIHRANAAPRVLRSTRAEGVCALCGHVRECFVCTVPGEKTEFLLGSNCLDKLYVLGSTLGQANYYATTAQPVERAVADLMISTRRSFRTLSRGDGVSMKEI